MPPKPFVDLSTLDFDHPEAGPEEIRKFNRQRYEMEHLDAIVKLDLEAGTIVGYKDVTDDEFWVRGHLPERPLLPGVIMCEAAAQLCSYYIGHVFGADIFLGFGGMQEVKFRRPVVPGERFVLIGKAVTLRKRRSILATQGFVDGKLVFEATIIGMPV